MNPDLARLHPYPFEKLSQLKQGCNPPAEKKHIALSMGEPKHPTPDFITKAFLNHIDGLASYPTTIGSIALRQAISEWLNSRFNLSTAVNPHRHVLPVNGTREALFAFAQTVIDRNAPQPLVVMPNPFYQIYEGATLLAGAEPYFLNCNASNHFIPDFANVSADVWERCQLLYLCSPSNPTGAVLDQATLTTLIKLAHQHHFIIASDECYSELYIDENNPPVGLLEAAVTAGFSDFSHCIVFHSLSKRSNVPGLRSGFVAGDEKLIKDFLLYRTYHGCAMPPATQAASLVAWQDEEHVRSNRELYRQKFTVVLDILSPIMNVSLPEAGFYLWAETTPISDTDFARQLFDQQHVTVLPGSFLARDTINGNPGTNHIRLALVPPIEECIEAALRIKQLIETRA